MMKYIEFKERNCQKKRRQIKDQAEEIEILKKVYAILMKK
jgi:hypothetical protein